MKNRRQEISKAYDKGYLDGYQEGCEVTHDVWVTASRRVKGVGTKLHAGLIAEMTNEVRSRSTARNLGQDYNLLDLSRQDTVVVTKAAALEILTTLEELGLSRHDEVIECLRRQVWGNGNTN